MPGDGKQGSDKAAPGTNSQAGGPPSGKMTQASEKSKTENRKEQLTALEEDDEFEEFEAEDWPVDPSAQSDLASLHFSAHQVGGVKAGEKVEDGEGRKKAGQGQSSEPLWDSTWDDDVDVGDEFSVILKNEIDKYKGASALVR